MNKIVGLLLVLVGALLLFQGWSRRDSLAGSAAQLGARVANRVDGGTRIPAYWYSLAGGAVLVLAGGGLALRKNS